MSSFAPPSPTAEIPVDGRHHVESMLMRESLLDKRVMSATETPVVSMLPFCRVLKVGGRSIVDRGKSATYPLVDAERGVVWAHVVFDQGTVNQGVLSDGTKHSYPGFNRPSSILVTEAFLIENGRIRRVEMIGPSAPYHMNSPWPGGLSGN